MDFEATCERAEWCERRWQHEIIEFPAVLLDAGNLEVVDEFRAFVRPTERPRLTAFCTELTSITQAEVDGGELLPVVLGRFSAWLTGHGLDAAAVLPVTCGDWDLKTMLPVECGRKWLEYPDALRRWCNIKDLFTQATQQSSRGMAGMLRTLGLRLEGHHHSGIDDSRNIARIFQTLLRRFGQAHCSPRLCGDRSGSGAAAVFGATGTSTISSRTAPMLTPSEKGFLKACKLVRDIWKLESQDGLAKNQVDKISKKPDALLDVRELLKLIPGDSDLRQKHRDVVIAASGTSCVTALATLDEMPS